MTTRAVSSSPSIDHNISTTEPRFSINSIKNRISDYVLTGRIMNNLQECVMIAGVAAAVVGIALTFFSGPPLLCACFTVLLATSSIGIYHARRHAALQGLQRTVDNLRTTQGRLEEVSDSLHQENNQFQITNQQLAQTAQTFQQENDRLQTTNQQLAQTHQEFLTTHGRFLQTHRDLETTHQNLEGTNQRLTRQVQSLGRTNQQLKQEVRGFGENNQQMKKQVQNLEKTNQEQARSFKENNQQLTEQVAELTLHVTQLSASANRIREEMVRFQEENGHLAENVRGFDDSLNLIKQEIDVSGALSAQIAKLLSAQRHDFGGQLGELRQLIIDLRTNGSTNEKLTQLTILHDQFREIQVQCATERANLEAIRTDLFHIQEDLRSGVAGLQEERTAFRTDFARIQQGMRSNMADQQEERAALHDERQGLQRQQERLQSLLDRISSVIESNLEATPFPDLPPLPRAVESKA